MSSADLVAYGYGSMPTYVSPSAFIEQLTLMFAQCHAHEIGPDFRIETFGTVLLHELNERPHYRSVCQNVLGNIDRVSLYPFLGFL